MIKNRTIGIGFVMFFIGFFLTFVLFVFSLYAGFTRVFDSKQIKKGVKQLDIASIEIDGDTIAVRLHKYVTEDGGNKLGYGNITVEQMEEVLELKELKSFAADKIADTVDCLVEGKGKVTITGDEMADMAEDCSDDIYDITGVRMSDNDIEKIRASFKGKEQVIFDAEEFFEDSSEDADAVREIIEGKYILYFVISITIILGMIVAIDFKNHKPYILKDVGFPMLISGIFANLLINAIPEIVKMVMEDEADEMWGVLMGLVSYITSSMAFYAYVLIVLGAIILGVFYALKFIDYRNMKNMNTTF